MKKIIKSILILMFIINIGYSQSVGIGTNSPNPSAALDISGSLKTMKIPSLTTTQMYAIASPAEGLIIYNNTYGQIMNYAGGQWHSIVNSDFWAKSVNNNRNFLNAKDSVAIGRSIPNQALDVNGNINSRQNYKSDDFILASGNLISSGNNIVTEDITTSGELKIKNSTNLFKFSYNFDDRAFAQLSGNDLRLGLFSANTNGRIVFNTNGVDRMGIRTNGHVTMGNNSTQDEMLYVNGKIDVNGDFTSTTASGNIETMNINTTLKGSSNNLQCLCYGEKRGGNTYAAITTANATVSAGSTIFINCPGIDANSSIIITPINNTIFTNGGSLYFPSYSYNALYSAPDYFAIKIYEIDFYPFAQQYTRYDVSSQVGFSFVVYK